MLKKTQPNPRELHNRLPIERVHKLLYFKSMAWLQKDVIELVKTPEGNTKFNRSWSRHIRRWRKLEISRYSYNTLRLVK